MGRLLRVGGLVLALATGAGTATAAAPSSAVDTPNADATASSEQQKPSNENLTVAAYRPGSDGSVTQENTSLAEAISTNDSQSGAAGQCNGNGRDVQATATSMQTGASNTNASVRVSSGGDSGAVTQVNSSEANATARATCTPTQRAEASASATQDGAHNANVSVRVFSDGNNGEVAQSNTSDAAPTAVGGLGRPLRASETAHEQQTDQQNINVSIRVKSEGTDGPVSQRDSSLASPSRAVGAKSGAGALEVAVEKDGQNINVAIAIASDALPPLKPGEFWLWRWVWPWEGDPSQVPDWQAIAKSLDGWTWDFSNPSATTPAGGPVVEKVGPASGIKAGTWSWKWAFTNNGQPIDWSWNESLDGCNCAWIWTWNWAWTNSQPRRDAQALGSPLPNAAATSQAITQSNSSSSLAGARNESTAQQAGQSTHVDQSAAASAESTQAGSYNNGARLGTSGEQAKSSAARAIAFNTSSVNRNGASEQSAQVVQSAGATATASGGSRSDSANAQAKNLSEIQQSSQIEAGDGAGVLCTTTTELPATCIQANEANVKQTAEATGDAVARNASRLEQSNQIARRDNYPGNGGGGSSADVCTADGPTTNCSQRNTATVGQEAVGDGDGASARNEAEVAAANQIAGRDAARTAASGSEESTGSAAGVCNAGGEAVNCRQENSVQIDEEASARRRTSVAREADVLALNQLAGRDAAASGTRMTSQGGTSAAGVCNAGGPTTNCTQENRIGITQLGYPEGRRGSAEEADVRGVNQIAGRDTAAVALRGSDQSGMSSAGVCNAGGPTTNCTQVNAFTISQEAGQGGRAWAENEAVNQIAGRDAYGSVAGAASESRDSSAGVCNVGGETTTCTQENAVAIVQEARTDRAADANVAAVNQIAGRDTGIGPPSVSNRSRDSFAGVCNAGGPAVDCTQRNNAQIKQEAVRSRSGESDADVAITNAIAGRDTAVGSSRLKSESRDSFAGVCNAGGPAINCTQENSVRAPQVGGRGSAENEAEVSASNQLAGRDAFKGAARATNRHRDSSAGVCNAGGETVNCTQSNTVAPESSAATRRSRAETEVVTVSQLAGRDAYAGSARARNRSLDTSIDLCSSDGGATGCAQRNHASIDRAGVVKEIKQIAGRNEHRGTRAFDSRGGPRSW